MWSVAISLVVHLNESQRFRAYNFFTLLFPVSTRDCPSCSPKAHCSALNFGNIFPHLLRMELYTISVSNIGNQLKVKTRP